MFSPRGIGGTKETGNRGLADLLIFKQECLGFVLGRWLSLVRVHRADHDSHSAAPTNWTRACTGPQLFYVEFLRESRVRHYVRFLSEVARQKNTMDVHCLKNRPA